jgi:hypothetical protein
MPVTRDQRVPRGDARDAGEFLREPQAVAARAELNLPAAVGRAHGRDVFDGDQHAP